MNEITYGNATVRIHGTTNPDKLHNATVKFMKKVHEIKKKKNGGTKNA